MATYRKIQEYVRLKYGYTVKTCWIADVKEREGLFPRRARNRRTDRRANPCPPDKLEPILAALRTLPD